jgi:hypothetical protein
MMKDFRRLENNILGFKTDRDPDRQVWNKKTEKYERVQPYDDQTVRRCVIAAFAQGAKLVGNEFNILAGNLYLTKKYWIPRVKQFPGLTALKIVWGVPAQSSSGKGWLFPVRANWRLHGKLDEIACVASKEFDSRIVVRGYETSSIDELRGRAESKLYRMIHERISGINLDLADSDDVIDVESNELIETDLQEIGPAKITDQQSVEEHSLPAKNEYASQMAGLLETLEKQLQKAIDSDSVATIVDQAILICESMNWPKEVKDSAAKGCFEIGRARASEID